MVISLGITFKIVGPADMMYFPGMADSFPTPAVPLVRETLRCCLLTATPFSFVFGLVLTRQSREAVSEMSIKQFIEDTNCLDHPLLSALNKKFDLRKVGLRVESGLSLLPHHRLLLPPLLTHTLNPFICHYPAKVTSLRATGENSERLNEYLDKWPA